MDQNIIMAKNSISPAMARKQSSADSKKQSKEVVDNKEEKKEIIVQYIVVRNDLPRNQDRSFNTLISHTASAATAAIHMCYKHEHTEEYLQDLDDLRKTIFQVDDEEQMFDLDNKLMLNKVDYKMWIKQPENYATCIATRPYPKSEIAEYFKNLKIFKK